MHLSASPSGSATAPRVHRSPRPVPEGSDCPLARRTERGRRQRDVLRGGRSGGGAERGGGSSGKRQQRRGRRGGAARGGQRLTAACGGSCFPPWAEAAADRRQAQRPGKRRAQPSRAHRAPRPGLRAMGRAGGGGPGWGPPPVLLLLGVTLVLTAGAVPGRYPPGLRPQPVPGAPPHARVSYSLASSSDSPAALISFLTLARVFRSLLAPKAARVQPLVFWGAGREDVG